NLDAARLAEWNGVEVETAGGGVGHDAESRLHEMESRARTPRLRVAGDQVFGRAVVVLRVAPKSAEQFGQTVIGHADAGFHDAVDDLARRDGVPVPAQARGRDRVVVGPDGAVVIAHGVVVGRVR